MQILEKSTFWHVSLEERFWTHFVTKTSLYFESLRNILRRLIPIKSKFLKKIPHLESDVMTNGEAATGSNKISPPFSLLLEEIQQMSEIFLFKM
jgi:hypothetical protein